MRCGHVRHRCRFADERFRRRANNAKVIEQPQRVQLPGNLPHCIVVQAALGEIIAGDADTDNKIVTAPCTDGFQDADAKTQAVR